MWSDRMRPLTRKHAALVVMVIMVIGAGSFWFYESTRTEFHYEAAYPAGDTRKVIMVVRAPRDANLTISFENDTSLLYRVDIGLYDPQSGSVIVDYASINVHSLELYCKGRQKRIDIVLGTATWYDITILRGDNLNTTIRFGNGAVLNRTDFDIYQTGIVRIAMDEHDGLTTYDSLFVAVDHPYGITGGLLFLLDIDLPEGYEGRLDTNGAPISFVERVGWGFLGNHKYGTSTEWKTPVVSVDSGADAIIARLID